MNDGQFISDVQKFVGLAVSVSALRRQGPGVIYAIQEYLGDAFSNWLEGKTSELVRTRGVKWGAARKALNLFLRDCLYNKYLSEKYDLGNLEAWMEMPVDSVVAGQLKKDAGRGRLPVWHGLKELTKENSEKFQTHAREMAARRNFARVHLDVGMWINNRVKRPTIRSTPAR